MTYRLLFSVILTVSCGVAAMERDADSRTGDTLPSKSASKFSEKAHLSNTPAPSSNSARSTAPSVTAHTSAASNLYREGSRIVDVFQSEAAFTHADDEKPIVATYGCGPCVAVGGYHAANKMAFMIHFATANEVLMCGDTIAGAMRPLIQHTLTPQAPILLHLRGGEKGRSESTIAAIQWWMNRYNDLPMTISSKEILRYTDEGRSLYLDARSGNYGDYNPELNPQRRIITQADWQRAMYSFRVPNIRIVYPQSQ